jgi:hypothetical protein
MYEENQSPTPQQTQLNASPELGKLFEALSKAQAEIKPAKLDMENPYYKSKYASLKSCQEAYRAPLAKFGLAIVQQVYSEQDAYYVRTVLGHSSGQWMSNVFKLIVGKRDMQGLGSAITYGRRYGANALVGVVDTEDDDGNNSLPPKGDNKPPQKTQPKTKAQDKKPPNMAPPGPGAPPDPFPDYENEPQKPMSLLEEVIQLSKVKNVSPPHMKNLIKKCVGEEKKAKDLTQQELKTVRYYLKMK